MTQIHIASATDIATLVHNDISAVAGRNAAPAIGIPGGRSAAPLIQGLLSCSADTIAKIRLFLVDERLEGERNADSLRSAGLQTAERQGAQLLIPQPGQPFFPNGRLALLYLGVGEDGHIASLFPGSFPGLDSADTGPVAIVKDSPKPPPVRITVTYRWFRMTAETAKVRLLFLGNSKREALNRFVSATEGTDSLPCRFFADYGFDVSLITDL